MIALIGDSLIRPEARRRIYWTNVSINTKASLGHLLPTKGFSLSLGVASKQCQQQRAPIFLQIAASLFAFGLADSDQVTGILRVDGSV
jgi:hypothetical protein